MPKAKGHITGESRSDVKSFFNNKPFKTSVDADGTISRAQHTDDGVRRLQLIGKNVQARMVAEETARAKAIVKAILADVTDRRGWKQEWGQFDTDTKREIKATWTALVLRELEK